MMRSRDIGQNSSVNLTWIFVAMLMCNITECFDKILQSLQYLIRTTNDKKYAKQRYRKLTDNTCYTLYMETQDVHHCCMEKNI